MGGVGGGWGVVLESSAGWAREAGRGEGEMGGDQTSVGATKGG